MARVANAGRFRYLDRMAKNRDEVSLEKRGGWITDAEKGQAALLSAQGHTTARIAATLGRSQRTIERALASDAVKAQRAQLLRSTTEQARAVLAAGAARAAERVVELVESERDDTALRASASVLDRVGIGASTTVKHVRELPEDELRSEYELAVKLLRERGEL